MQQAREPTDSGSESVTRLKITDGQTVGSTWTQRNPGANQSSSSAHDEAHQREWVRLSSWPGGHRLASVTSGSEVWYCVTHSLAFLSPSRHVPNQAWTAQRLKRESLFSSAVEIHYTQSRSGTANAHGRLESIEFAFALPSVSPGSRAWLARSSPGPANVERPSLEMIGFQKAGGWE